MRQLFGLLFAAVLVAAPAAGLHAQQKIQTGGPISPDGSATVACDLAVSQRTKNVGGSDGAGLCVFSSIGHAARWQNERRLIDFQKAMRAERGGGWPQKVDQMIKKYGAGTKYYQYEGTDMSLLKLALACGRMPSVTYNGRDGVHYNSTIAHMVNLVYLDDALACVLDNNFVGDNELVWLTADQFKARWTGGQQGWAVFLWAAPPPPLPTLTSEPVKEEAKLGCPCGSGCPGGCGCGCGDPSNRPIAKLGCSCGPGCPGGCGCGCICPCGPGCPGGCGCGCGDQPARPAEAIPHAPLQLEIQLLEVSLQPQFAWKQLDGVEAGLHYLYQDGVLVGVYNGRTGLYRPWDTQRNFWAMPGPLPTEAPRELAQRPKAKEQPPKKADVEPKQDPKLPVPGGMDLVVPVPVPPELKEEPKLEKLVGDLLPTGVFWKPNSDGKERFAKGSLEISRKELVAGLIGDGGKIPEDQKSLRVTFILPTEADVTRARNDWDSSPKLAEFHGKIVEQYYTLGHWHVDPKLGFPKEGGVLVQRPPRAKDGWGQVLHYQKDYTGPDDLAQALRRAADPNFDPNKSPDLRKPQPLKPGPGPAGPDEPLFTEKNLPWLLAGGLAFFLALTMLRNRKEGS